MGNYYTIDHSDIQFVNTSGPGVIQTTGIIIYHSRYEVVVSRIIIFPTFSTLFYLI